MITPSVPWGWGQTHKTAGCAASPNPWASEEILCARRDPAPPQRFWAPRHRPPSYPPPPPPPLPSSCTNFSCTRKGILLFAQVTSWLAVLTCSSTSTPGHSSLPVAETIVAAILFAIYMCDLHTKIQIINWPWSDFFLYLITSIVLAERGNTLESSQGVLGLIDKCLFGYDAYTSPSPRGSKDLQPPPLTLRMVQCRWAPFISFCSLQKNFHGNNSSPPLQYSQPTPRPLLKGKCLYHETVFRPASWCGHLYVWVCLCPLPSAVPKRRHLFCLDYVPS